MKVKKFVVAFFVLFFAFGYPAFAAEDTSEKYWEDYLDTAPNGSVSSNPEKH